MAEFLTTNGISFYIDKIIKSAGVELYLLMPYLQLSLEFYEALKELSDRGVNAIIVYTNEDLHTEEKLALGELSNLEIYHSQNLNTRCCCSEESALITSMDMHQFTGNENIDMGVLFSKSEDSDMYRKITSEVKSIVNSSRNMNLHKRPIEELDQLQVKVKKVYHGFCIKCAMPISYNIKNPYCRSCMPKDDIPDGKNNGIYCHVCGTESPTSVSSPVCTVCNDEKLTQD